MESDGRSGSELESRSQGGLFMSLIHTCELNGANAFDYLMELLRHA